MPVVVRQTLILFGLFAVSFVLRLYPVMALHFDGLYGQDAFAYYGYGQQVRDAITHLTMPGHFYWPLGYPALVALGFIFGQQPGGPQLISLIAGAMVSAFAYLLTVQISRSRLAGVIAWAVVAVCGQLIQSSMVIMADASGLMWATFSAWALFVYVRNRQLRWIMFSSFALAWATMTRWQYGGLVVVWAIYILIQRPLRWRHILMAVAIGPITLLPQIAHVLRYPDMLLGHSWVQDWSLFHAFARDFIIPDGTFHYQEPPLQFYAQPLTNVYYMSPLFVVFVVIGAIAVWKKNPQSAALLLGWILVQYGFLIGIPYENIRFPLSFVPPIAVFVGIGAAWLITSHALVRFVVIGLLIFGLISTLKATVPNINRFVAAKNADLAAAQWIEQHIPESGAPVYVLDLLLTMEHYTQLQPIQIYELPVETLRSQLATTKNAYAVFNDWTTEHQWNGQSPWIIYHWLEDNPGLTKIGSYGPYTLYRIGP